MLSHHPHQQQQQPNSPSSSAFLETTMPKPHSNHKPTSLLTDTFIFLGGSLVALLLLWSLWSFLNPTPTSFSLHHSTSSNLNLNPNCPNPAPDLLTDPPNPTFYDDPNLTYSLYSHNKNKSTPVKNWDDKRRQWLSHHPSFAAGVENRILLLTGSQPTACDNPIGDHLLLRFFKNKVDYCRIHGHDIFYNNAFFHPKMTSYWAKLPLVRAAMIAHPESEWIWWVDSDAAFTDMEFKLPLDKYRDHNLIVHGWANMVYQEKSWVALNAGIFLIRNCQWSMDFMDVWASMGPQTPDYAKWSKIQRDTFADKLFPESDDQSALVYLLLKQKDTWADKIYLESDYLFEGYWEEIVGTLDNVTRKYHEMERGVRSLRRRHAEKVSERYGVLREPYVKDVGYGKWGWRRPFITHFTGCQPCSGNFNERYTAESCWNGMERALNFADNQVLRTYGLARRDLLDPSSLSPLPFDAAGL